LKLKEKKQMRSKLFVPATRTDFFEKALRSQADAISFDLEDAVLENRKLEARENLSTYFSSAEFLQLKAENKKTIIVRINPLDSGHLEQDLVAICKIGVDMVNIPKSNTEADIFRFVEILTAVENKTLVPQGASIKLKVLANIESPSALINAAKIASHPRVWGLQLGLGDLFEPRGIERYEPINVHHVMLGMSLAAGASNKIAYDSAFTNVADPEGFRAEAIQAKKAGFLGKTCIHPNQVAIANAVFSPSEAEIQWANKVLASAQENMVNGAFMLDGKMIDAPFIARAQSILDSVRSS
jgi:citrate lyase subunit beta/citryl-CoA lyase